MMPLSKPTPTGDTPALSPALLQNLAALHDTLSRLGLQNRDASLQPLIADSLSRCVMLRKYLDRMSAGQAGPEPIADAQVFQRLMALAGPSTAIELLDQLQVDLDEARAALVAALPAQNWATLRAKCHVLIAVAGSIGAFSVQTNAEHLHAAATREDADAVTMLVSEIDRRLLSLIGFVQDERLARGT
jgi:HPt (histidine-containing phosphotransfer) domain-containing protein